MITILYEDNHLLVIHKPSGILSQPDITNDPSVLSELKLYLKEKYHKPGDAYLGLVHRLDRMTEGVMVLAKTSKAAARLSQAIASHDHSFVKKYYAICHKPLPVGQTNQLVDYLDKDKQGISFLSKTGQKAILEYQVIKSNQDTSLVSITLLTGRHHQIRIQFANIGHPLVGDCLYGSDQRKYLGLCAYQLGFNHPVTKEWLEFTIKPLNPLFKDYF